MDKIAIIIVHYNTNEDTLETLESLESVDTSGLKVKTYVVDNGSVPSLVLPSKWAKKVRLLRSDSNLGFAGGNNLGFETASREFDPEYFLLLNSDTLVQPDFLQKLYQALQHHPDWGLATPKMYFAPGCEFHRHDYGKKQQGHVIWFAGGSIDWDNLLTIHQGVDEVDRGQFSQEATMTFATGCCFLIRREILANVGVFDERYFLYYEDVDLSWRVRHHNFLLGFVPQAIIWHKNGGSAQGSGSDLQTFYQTRNRLLFFSERGDILVKLRTWRLSWRLWRHGSAVEKKAVKCFWSRQFGKQAII
ncbi:glycosyltransferase family 2 protein [bacterium]|nr:glycosyltransferase family 2 protein [bacterium]